MSFRKEKRLRISKIVSRECKIMVVCRKCGKEVKDEEISYEYLLDNRRGKVSSEKICLKCN